MQQYIMFENRDFKGVKNYRYQKGVKYRIKSQDAKYFYVMGDKIQKDKLDSVKYVIDNIKEFR